MSVNVSINCTHLCKQSTGYPSPVMALRLGVGLPGSVIRGNKGSTFHNSSKLCRLYSINFTTPHVNYIFYYDSTAARPPPPFLLSTFEVWTSINVPCHPPATAFTMIGSNVSLVPLYSGKRSLESKIGKKASRVREMTRARDFVW